MTVPTVIPAPLEELPAAREWIAARPRLGEEGIQMPSKAGGAAV